MHVSMSTTEIFLIAMVIIFTFLAKGNTPMALMFVP